MKKRSKIFGLRYLERIKPDETRSGGFVLPICGIKKTRRVSTTYVWDPPRQDVYWDDDIVGTVDDPVGA